MSADIPTTESPNHIIERPRLLKKLDEATGRLILLVAPAGYGKTTLARRWLRRRPSARYEGTRAGRDVAALAAGLADTAELVVTGSATRMRARLSATRAPEEDAHVLADILAEDLSAWPSEAWLAIDDYHCLTDAPGADAFVETLFDGAPVNLLIATRARPTWITSRRLLYGEALELDQNWLRMEIDEAHQILQGLSPRYVSALVEHSRGWPAVLGLAARVGEAFDGIESLPPALYDYFAEELFGSLPSSLQADLQLLALVSTVRSSRLQMLFGSRFQPLIESGEHVGFLGRSHDAVEVHPLLRAYLETQIETSESSSTVGTALHTLVEERMWDEAFQVASRFNRDEYVIELLGLGAQSLLEQGKLTTLTRWVQFARARHVVAPAVDLAEAHVALHQGRFETSELVAVRLAKSASDERTIARAYAVAGAAAHLGSSPDAFDHFTEAALRSDEADVVLQARIGQFLSALEFRPEITPTLIGDLADIDDRDPATTVRLLAHQIMYGHRAGGLGEDSLRVAVRRAEAGEALLSQVLNPLARTAYLNALGYGNCQLGRYRKARSFGRRLLQEGVRYKLALMMPYANYLLAASALGRRHLSHAEGTCRTAIAQAKNLGHVYAEMNATALLARIKLVAGDPDGALQLTDVDLRRPPLPALAAEFVVLRALIMAATGEINGARNALSEARGRFYDGQIQALRDCTAAVIADQDPQSTTDSEALIRNVLERGQIDTFVCSYRAYPDLLRVALEIPKWSQTVEEILVEACDTNLSQRIGFATKSNPSDDELSPRETEVMQLLIQGLRNKEIAQRLFISDVTVKAHLRRAYEKLGVNSRTAALIAFQRKGAN